MGMLTLIAESKSMSACTDEVTQTEWKKYRPLFETGAEELINFMSGFNKAELAERIGISHSLAASMIRMIHDFPDKSRGANAITAFTGVVFKALDFATLPMEARKSCEDNVRILSSLYGWLRPMNIIKAYRLDYTSQVAPGGLTAATYWKARVTDCLNETLEAGHYSDMLDLLPADAAKLIDRKVINNTVRIWKADFMEIQPGGGMKRPNASKLKKLRGILLRQILTEGIDSPEGLRNVETDQFYFDSISDNGTISFLTVK